MMTATPELPLTVEAEKNYLNADTSIRSWLLTPTGGTMFLDLPLGRTPDTAVSSGIGIRLTAPTSAVNARAEMIFERC